MKTTAFLAALRARPELPLIFRTDAHAISPHYHLTEVKRVGYETMDCGGQLHRWNETQLELWVPPLVGSLPGRGHLRADKFLRIIDRVEAELPLSDEAGVRIYASFGGQPTALYDVSAVTVEAGSLVASLQPVVARCKAAERRVGSMLGGCCGTGAEANSAATDAAASTGCGCGTAPTPEKATASCCA